MARLETVVGREWYASVARDTGGRVCIKVKLDSRVGDVRMLPADALAFAAAIVAVVKELKMLEGTYDDEGRFHPVRSKETAPEP